MTVDLFHNFDLNSQACMTWKKGIHLGYRAKGPDYMSLYRLDNFYVEIQYTCCYDGIACIQTFTCEDELQAYLDQVDINQILA